MFSSLVKKIAFAVILISIIIASVYVYFAYSTGIKFVRKQAEQRAYSLASVFTEILKGHMETDNCDNLVKVLRASVESEEILNVLILRQDGTIYKSVYSLGENEKKQIRSIFESFDLKKGNIYIKEQSDQLLEYVIVPIPKKQECYTCHLLPEKNRGYFSIIISLKDIQSAAEHHRLSNILMTIIMFGGLSGVIFLAVKFLIVKPIRVLNNHLNTIEKEIQEIEIGNHKDFTLLNVIKRKDEISDLYRNFNFIIQRLNESYKKIFELHQNQLEHADRLATTGEIAASIAHEIKNPVAGILSALQVFENDFSDSEEKKEIYSEIKFQLERINYAINDLLNYARPTSPNFEEFYLDDILQRIVILFNPQLKEKNVQLETKINNESLKINGDKKQLQQVLWNILINAYQAVSYQGKISIIISEKNSNVQIFISDNGKGMTKETLKNVFKPFYTSKHKGTGLGLTISKRIVEQHKGTIELESEVGIGTTVKIIIPKNLN